MPDPELRLGPGRHALASKHFFAARYCPQTVWGPDQMPIKEQTLITHKKYLLLFVAKTQAYCYLKSG